MICSLFTGGFRRRRPATRRPSSRGRTRRRIRQIDALVYELYGLLEEEVALVEEAAR